MKLIATDLDGTLLNSQKIISTENLETLHKAYDRGVHLVIATGRFWGDARRVLTQLDIPFTLVSSNGACIHDPQGNRIYSGSMNPRDCQEAFQWLAAHGYYFEATTENGIYAWRHHWENLLEELPVLKEARPEADIERLQMLLNRQATTKQSSEAESLHFLDQLQEAYYNVLIIAFDPVRRAAAREHFSVWGRFTVSSSWAYNLELIAPTDSKGRALELVCRNIGIPLAEAVALGDHENDLSMLQAAGRGVAMANGDAAVLCRCPVITRTHDENGVSIALERLMEDPEFVGDLR